MARQKTSLESSKTPPEIARALEFVGLFTRVARAVGVTPSHAVQVAKGKRVSARVVQAVVKEVRKIDRQTERAA